MMSFQDDISPSTRRYRNEGYHECVGVFEQESERMEREGGTPGYNPYFIIDIDERSFLECFVNSGEKLLMLSIFNRWLDQVKATSGTHITYLHAESVPGTNQSRTPDSSWTPRDLPSGRSRKWPTLVLEVSYSQTRAYLKEAMQFWLDEPESDVKVAISITVSDRKILLERWVRRPNRPTSPDQWIEIAREPRKGPRLVATLISTFLINSHLQFKNPYTFLFPSLYFYFLLFFNCLDCFAPTSSPNFPFPPPNLSKPDFLQIERPSPSYLRSRPHISNNTMVRNLVVIGGNSHPQLTQSICAVLGIPPAEVLLSKFAVGETRVEIQESVREKDVYIIQSGGGKVNDHLLELLITISACKTASARRVTAVLPLFPYSRQSDIPYDKAGAPLVKASVGGKPGNGYTFESTPSTPALGGKTEGLGLMNGIESLQKGLAKAQIEESTGSPVKRRGNGLPRSDTTDSLKSVTNGTNGTDDAASNASAKINSFQPRPGYKQWVAQAGTLVADLLTCAGADHIITMDLHDPQYQGYFDIPVDNLYGRPLLKSYIQRNIPNYKQAVIVSPDAGGAKRATAIADQMGMEFALIHKERRPTKITDRQNATMMLVGDVRDRITILIDDLADTSNTITRAAKLLKKEGASQVYALLTHGILSGDAIERINASALDKVVVTNSVDQVDHLRRCPKLEVLEVGHVFGEAIRRVHHGESISVLFQYD
ncbi:unnamed protein product [Penicillium nalgiovense]|nr:unnamed protein product [Penicillium nalgiovense]